jgi:hypothetical protein
MKKSILTAAFLLFVVVANAQDEKTVTGLFEGFDKEVYSFSYGDEEYIYFDECESHLLEEYDLLGEDLLYETFTVTYSSTKGKDGELKLTIVGLELIPDDEDE